MYTGTVLKLLQTLSGKCRCQRQAADRPFYHESLAPSFILECRMTKGLRACRTMSGC